MISPVASSLAVAGFAVIAAMLTIYVVLDGYDLGVAAIALWIGRTDRERSVAMESIGPFWNGNEVWLIAAGGALFALFPKAYASSFSGFYLPLIIVLWLLMFRGIAMELRDHFAGELWHQFWDAAFTLSSTLLILIFGVALGNLLRGVPLDNYDYFQGTFAFLLNPYALGVGLLALATLAQHGATFLALRVEGPLMTRSLALARSLWWAVLVLYLAMTAATFAVRGVPAPWTGAIAIASLAALAGVRFFSARNREDAAFAASSVFVATLPIAAATSIFPYIIPAFPLGSGGLSIFDATPSAMSLACALVVTIGGLTGVIVYGTVVAHKMMGKIQ